MYKEIGTGIVDIDKVRVYHHFWGKFLPSKIKLNWNDDDAMPFVCYLDEKVRLLFGSSDERHPDLFSKMERLRFNYPEILLQGRVWKRRKVMVIDQFYYSNRLSRYFFISEFLEIAGHYVEGICDYNLIFKKSESSNKVYMDTINEVYDKCLSESHRVPTHNHIGKKMKLSLH
jgi:hypothetical protein